MDNPSLRSATPPAGPPTQGQGSGFGSTVNGGNEGNEDLKSSDDVDDADIEGHVISSDPEPDAVTGILTSTIHPRLQLPEARIP